MDNVLYCGAAIQSTISYRIDTSSQKECTSLKAVAIAGVRPEDKVENP